MQQSRSVLWPLQNTQRKVNTVEFLNVKRGDNVKKPPGFQKLKYN